MNKIYTTSDLNFASVLMSLDYHLEKLDRKDINKIQFVFTYKKQIHVDIKKFWDRQLKIEPRILFENQRGLKNMIFNN